MENKKGMFIEIVEDDEEFPYYYGESIIWQRRFDDKVLAEIRAKNTKPKLDKDGEPVIINGIAVTETDEAAVNRDLTDYIIKRWEGVKTPGGQDVPCNYANKQRLPPAIRRDLISRNGLIQISDLTQKKTN